MAKIVTYSKRRLNSEVRIISFSRTYYNDDYFDVYNFKRRLKH